MPDMSTQRGEGLDRWYDGHIEDQLIRRVSGTELNDTYVYQHRVKKIEADYTGMISTITMRWIDDHEKLTFK